MPRARKSRIELLQVTTEIKRLRRLGWSPQQICKTMNYDKDDSSRRLFWYYMSKTFEQDAQELKRMSGKFLAHEIVNAKERLELVVRTMTKVLEDDKASMSDKQAAAETLRIISVDIARLIRDGPTGLSDMGQDLVKKGEGQHQNEETRGSDQPAQ